MPSSPRIVKAPAKINLFLNVLNARADGFHEVCFIMQSLALADMLSITPLEEGCGLTFSCSDTAIATADNIIVKAYTCFYEAIGLPPKPLGVELQKNIPIAAGLGGGSSDAAAFLKVLNKLHDDVLSPEKLQALAAQLGSDVPFFLYGGTCLATGRGEQIEPLPDLPAFEVALLKPKAFNIATPEAYHTLKRRNCYQVVETPDWVHTLSDSSLSIEVLGATLFNDFETALFPEYPQLQSAKETLLRLNLPGVVMSGSGPTILALLNQADQQWPEIQTTFSQVDWFLCRTHFLPRFA